jgi:protein-S-isoprenylcysteine O-methyltransferase Ste14
MSISGTGHCSLGEPMNLMGFETNTIEAKRFSKPGEHMANIRIDHNSTITQINRASDRTASVEHPAVAALIDLALVIIFGLQHSVMARPWFKQRVMARMPEQLQRVTYVHMANAALFLLILLWQPIPIEIWNVEDAPAREMLWLLFAAGWVVLFLGAWSFGILDLLGIEHVIAWREGRRHAPRLKTGFLYRWLRHPMYVGVLLGMWATPRMSFGHLLLALAMTGYVLIAMRYEERDLMQRFGSSYHRWRGAA